jgi:UDP-N-acetylmuramate dehydrogenase
MPYVSKLLQLCDSLGCECSLNEPLKDHITFKVGGNCKAFIEISSVDSASKLIQFLTDNAIKYAILGNGSNVIVQDNGFDGVILHLGEKFSTVQLLDDNRIKAYSGASLKKVCLMALQNSLTGLEFAYGIPGSVGGALFMNAGAYGGEMVNVVKEAEYITSDGTLNTISIDDMQLSYRHSIFSDLNDAMIVSVTIECQSGNYDNIKLKMDELLKARQDKQPLEYASAGSTFKRPTGNYASKLIDECGLRGFSNGDAQVSEKHCGFVINRGNATCKNILDLTNDIIEIVHKKTGYTLELEPRILK